MDFLQWNTWLLRCYILTSLTVHAFLLLFASLRKSTAKTPAVMLIWLAYLVAGWAADSAIAFIFSSVAGTYGDEVDVRMQVFWASVLLFHLGGPDNITSFALEDNELWLRQLLGLFLKLLPILYLYSRSAQVIKDRFTSSTILLVISGFIKCVLRAWASYNASLANLRDSMRKKPEPALDYAELAEVYSSMKKANLPLRLNVLKDRDKRLGHGERVNRLFGTVKRLVADLNISSRERRESRNFFLEIDAKYAFEIMQFELSLLYEFLHTNVFVAACRKTGLVLRLVSAALSVAGSSTLLDAEIYGLDKFDVRLIKALLGGIIVEEIVSLVMLMTYDRVDVFDNDKRRRWSNSCSQFNLIRYCMKDPLKWMATILDNNNIQKAVTNMLFKSSRRIPKALKEFIFNQLKEKSFRAEDIGRAREISLERGDRVLLQSSSYRLCEWSLAEAPYGKSLILWHVATELCYQAIDNRNRPTGIEFRFCKLLSDYALYLLVMQPSMMGPSSGNWQMIYQDTCAEAKIFFRGSMPDNISEACEQIRAANTDIKPSAANGDPSNSVLFDACILAKKLLDMEEVPWKLVAQVWVELLCYAAIHCRANVHAQQPSRGGELLTFIWLLMNHLGLGSQFDDDDDPVTKIVVGK